MFSLETFGWITLFWPLEFNSKHITGVSHGNIHASGTYGAIIDEEQNALGQDVIYLLDNL